LYAFLICPICGACPTNLILLVLITLIIFVREDNLNMKIANKLRNVAGFKYLRMTVTNQNYNRKEIGSRLNLGNPCYHSVQNILSSHLLSRNLKIKIYKTMILNLSFYYGLKLGLSHYGKDID
jgi:hypothetical protein